MQYHRYHQHFLYQKFDDKTKDYAVTLTINEARENLNDVKVLAVYKTDNNDVMFPSLGLLDDPIDIFPSSNVNDKQKNGLTLNISSKTNIDKLYLLFSYVKNDERISNFYEVIVECLD